MSQPPQYPPGGGPPPSQPPGGWDQPPGGSPPGQPPGWGQQPPPGQPPGWGQQPPGQPPGWGQQPPGPPRRNNTVLFVLLGVLAVAVVGIGAVLLTQDDDDSGGSASTDDQSSSDEPSDEPASPEEQAFIDALAEANASSSQGLISGGEADCLAQATVDAVGLETLQGATSPEEISADPEASLVELGVEVDQAQVDQFAEATTGCIDVMQVMTESIEADGGSQELAACVEENLDESVAASRLAAEFIGNQAARDAAEADFNDALTPCQEAGT